MYLVNGISIKSSIIGFLLICFGSLGARADIDHTKLKGIQRLLRPEYSYLSPIEGFTLLKKGILENLYWYGNDQDQTVQLIRNLFYAVDRVNFNVTKYPSNMITHLTTGGIGSILNEMLVQDETVEGRILEVIYKDLGLDPNPAGPSKFSSKERQILRKSSKQFVKLLLGAVQETSSSNLRYRPHFPEQILLGLFWQKAKNDRTEILELLYRFRPDVRVENIFGDLSFSEWVNDQYAIVDYENGLTKVKTKYSSKKGISLINNVEFSVFMAHSYDIWERLVPPLVPYTQASQLSSDGKSEKFADCGETSVRNFFNIVFKNIQTQKFDTKFARNKAAENHLTLNENLLKFYETNNQPSGIQDSKLHSDWAAVVSRLPHVKYKQPTFNSFCNITGGAHSVLELFGDLIFSNDSWKLLQTSEKFDLISDFFSRPDFQLEWKLSEKSPLDSDGYGDVNFLVNGKLAFVWSFQSGHFYIMQKFKPAEDWRTDQAQPLLNRLSRLKDATDSLGMLSWFLDRKWIKKAFESLASEDGIMDEVTQQFLLLSLPLGEDASKLDAVDIIFSKKWKNLYPMAKKLISEIPENEFDLRSKSMNLLLRYRALVFEGDFSEYYLNYKLNYFKDIFCSRNLMEDAIFNSVSKNFVFLLPELVKENPAVLEIVSAEGYTPLLYSIVNSYVSMVELLLKSGAGPNSGNDILNIFPLTLAVKKKLPKVVVSLLNHGAELNDVDLRGRTALHFAVLTDQLNMVKLLVTRGASTEMRDVSQKTPRDVALESGNQKIATFLTEFYQADYIEVFPGTYDFATNSE